jgi:hypothetical protein
MKGIPLKQLRSEQRRRRDQAASGLALGAGKPPKAIPVPAKPSRPSEPLPAMCYPVKRSSLSKRQEAKP